MKELTKNFPLSLFAILFTVGFVASCGTEDDHDHEEHSDPEGLALYVEEALVAKQENGTVTYTDGDDHLHLHMDEAIPSEVFFLDDDGDEFHPEEDHYSLGVEADPEGRITATFAGSIKWGFTMQCNSEGAVDVTFKLLHDDHADFVSQDIEVICEEHDEDHED